MSEEEYRQHVNKINENIGNILKDHDEELMFYVNLVKRFNDICEESKKQKEVISKYLPKMMSEAEIRSEIEKLSDKSIPSIMKHFKANFDGKADMGLVNKIARSL